MINKAMIIGNLGNDPKISATQTGSLVANLSIATSEKYKDKSGQRQERVEWHRVVAFGRLAEICEQYLKKGDRAYISGRLQTRQWEDQSGAKRYSTEIIARELQMLGGKGKESINTNEQVPSSTTGDSWPEYTPPTTFENDNIPF